MEISLTGYDEGMTTTVGSLSANLAELVAAMIAADHGLIAVVSFSDERYVQFMTTATGEVMGEVISNLNIGDMVALSREDEEELRRIGFRAPAPGPNPNWWFHATDGAGFLRLMKMMNDAIYGVLGERAGNEVVIRTFPSLVPVEMDMTQYRTVSRVYYEQLAQHRERDVG